MLGMYEDEPRRRWPAAHRVESESAVGVGGEVRDGYIGVAKRGRPRRDSFANLAAIAGTLCPR